MMGWNRPNYNPRLLAIKTPEDMWRELRAIDVDSDEGKKLAWENFHYYLKLEKVDPKDMVALRDTVGAFGGKVFVSHRQLEERGVADVLLVGNAAFFEASATGGEPRNDQALLQEVETIRRSQLENRSLIVEWNGRKIDFSSRTYIMGIVNITPDSFADGGVFFDHEKAISHALAMVEEGADILDVGGESTRPGAAPVEMKEELRRVIPVIKGVLKKTNAIVSIDTTKAGVAEAALSEGASIVNDVSALRFEPDLGVVAAKQNVPLVLMHMRGAPQTMQKNIQYRELISDITRFLRERISFAERCGVAKEKIILDPGIGFGKSVQRDNFTILRNLQEFGALGRPLLVGPSRKAFLGRLLDLPVTERDEATAAAVAVAIMNGANIIRVHDVKKMKRVARVVDTIKQSEPLYETEEGN